MRDGLSARSGAAAQVAVPAQASWVAAHQGRLRLAKTFLRVAYAVGALLLFIFALEVLKTAAGGVADVLTGVSARGTANILGFGWLGAYGALSGSPVAAVALSLFAGDVISDSEAFAMLNGSRMGASFIVLLVGFLYYVGKRRTADGIFIGVVAMLTTFTIYAPVVPIGSFVLDRGWLDGVEVGAPAFLLSFTGFAFEPLADAAADNLPLLLVFVGGIGLILASFAVFDRALPNLGSASGGRLERISRLLHHPLVMFALGLLITTMTLSVSISLTLLIPLSLKGYVRRDGIIPYVMGANISTWVDTMFAALLLDSPRAVTVVFTQMAVGAFVSLAVLLLLYRPYCGVILAVAHRVTQRRREFAIFLGAIFLVPLALFFL